MPLPAKKILIPMDLTQTDHLKAYGVAYHALQDGENVEWLLNYRGSPFLMDYNSKTEKECAIEGVRWEVVQASEGLQVYRTIQENNMETILLEKAPKVAVYIPENFEPWDDAVTLASMANFTAVIVMPTGIRKRSD